MVTGLYILLTLHSPFTAIMIETAHNFSSKIPLHYWAFIKKLCKTTCQSEFVQRAVSPNVSLAFVEVYKPTKRSPLAEISSYLIANSFIIRTGIVVEPISQQSKPLQFQRLTAIALILYSGDRIQSHACRTKNI